MRAKLDAVSKLGDDVWIGEMIKSLVKLNPFKIDWLIFSQDDLTEIRINRINKTT